MAATSDGFLEALIAQAEQGIQDTITTRYLTGEQSCPFPCISMAPYYVVHDSLHYCVVCHRFSDCRPKQRLG